MMSEHCEGRRVLWWIWKGLRYLASQKTPNKINSSTDICHINLRWVGYFVASDYCWSSRLYIKIYPNTLSISLAPGLPQFWIFLKDSYVIRYREKVREFMIVQHSSGPWIETANCKGFWIMGGKYFNIREGLLNTFAGTVDRYEEAWPNERTYIQSR